MNVPLTLLRVALPVLLCCYIKFFMKELRHNRVSTWLVTDAVTLRTILIVRMSLFDISHAQHRLSQLQPARSLESCFTQLKK